jgi:hypothetical protein
LIQRQGKGGRTRLLNCALDTKVEQDVITFYVNAEQPLEIVNTRLTGVALHLTPGAKVRLTNSMFQKVNFNTTEGEGNVCNVDIDRCLLSSNIYGFYVAGTGRTAFSAKQCWLETGHLLQTEPKTQVTWRGEKNVFAIGGAAFCHRPTEILMSLSAWQKHFNTDADSRSVDPLFYGTRFWQLLNQEKVGAEPARIGTFRP